MNNDYHDITERLGPPGWWDEHAVPRYCDFHPKEIANIYANEVVYFLIECQNCGAEFSVAMSSTVYGRYIRGTDPPEFAPTLQDRIKDSTLHYGDPPNNNCCATGPTMNSVPRKTLQVWIRTSETLFNEDLGFVRLPDLEGIDLTPDWAKNGQR